MSTVLRRYLPKTLFARTLLILVAPVILLQVVVAIVFIQRHYEAVTRQMTGSVASEINYAINALEAAPDIAAARAELARLAPPLGLELGLDEGATVAPDIRRDAFDYSGGQLIETMRRRLGRPLAVDLVTIDKMVDISVQTSRGILRVLAPRRRMISSNPHILLVWTGASGLLLVGVAILFLRNQIRPIRQLAAAAEAFGKGQHAQLRPAGAREVRAASAAFLDMRDRIERQIEQRTRMLSGVSHDLRTPLTRMKLALAVAEPGPEIEELSRDVDEMERMLGEFLDFARGEAGEPAAPADPVALAESVAQDARRAGAKVSVFSSLETPEQPETTMRAGAVRRALANLADNAARYGDQVAISVRVTRNAVEFVVEDDGPGIPAASRADAIRPFTRLDAARNQDRGGGVGLGLSIAADVASGHGGALTLGDSDRLGGLKATLRLPR